MFIYRVAGLLLLTVMLSACSSSSQSLKNSVSNSADYDRHRMSRLVMPMDGSGSDTIIFEASISPTYPESDPAAEELRMQWLASWLEVRQLCPAGYDILERRQFDVLDYNPAHHDLRYELRCKITVPAA